MKFRMNRWKVDHAKVNEWISIIFLIFYLLRNNICKEIIYYIYYYLTKSKSVDIEHVTRNIYW